MKINVIYLYINNINNIIRIVFVIFPALPAKYEVIFGRNRTNKSKLPVYIADRYLF